jgi:hypothetical protein
MTEKRPHRQVGPTVKSVKRREENNGKTFADATADSPRISKAPAPIREVGGRGSNPPRPPEPLRENQFFPTHFPRFLRSQMSLICEEAIRKHKDRTHAVACGAAIVREAINAVAQAVRAKKLSDGEALSNIDAYVEQFARANSDPIDVLKLEDAIKKSDVWRNFKRAIVAARQEAAGTSPGASDIVDDGARTTAGR